MILFGTPQDLLRSVGLYDQLTHEEGGDVLAVDIVNNFNEKFCTISIRNRPSRKFKKTEEGWSEEKQETPAEAARRGFESK